MKNIAQVLAVLGVVALIVGTFILFSPPAQANLATATNIGSVATTSAATSITTSARIMATTTNTVGTGYNRVYAVVCNPNANPVWLNLDGDKASNLPGGAVTTVIAAAAGYSTCFEITDRNSYNDSVTASSTNQTATTITVKQYVQ